MTAAQIKSEQRKELRLAAQDDPKPIKAAVNAKTGVPIAKTVEPKVSDRIVASQRKSAPLTTALIAPASPQIDRVIANSKTQSAAAEQKTSVSDRLTSSTRTGLNDLADIHKEAARQAQSILGRAPTSGELAEANAAAEMAIKELRGIE